MKEKDIRINTIQNIFPITHPKLIALVQEWNIDLNSENRYCNEIHYRNKDKLTNAKMKQIAKEYLSAMGIVNTQYIIGRHYNKEHPHIHIVFNRVENNGKTISDKNDRYRSEKICKELTEKYGLYFAQGKENMKVHRLKEPDKTKYEIYDALKANVTKCKNWIELKKELQKQGITTSSKNKGNSDEAQGIMFEKNGYKFNGSKIDRQFSYSKIDSQLKQNDKTQDFNTKQEHNLFQNQSSVLENVGSALGGLFDIQSSGTDYDPDEVEFQKQQKLKKKKGFRI